MVSTKAKRSASSVEISVETLAIRQNNQLADSPGAESTPNHNLRPPFLLWHGRDVIRTLGPGTVDGAVPRRIEVPPFLVGEEHVLPVTVSPRLVRLGPREAVPLVDLGERLDAASPVPSQTELDGENPVDCGIAEMHPRLLQLSSELSDRLPEFILRVF